MCGGAFLVQQAGGGGVSPPADFHPLQFPLKCFAFPGAETVMKQFLLRGASSPAKKVPRIRRTRRRIRLKLERAAALTSSPGFLTVWRLRMCGGAFLVQGASGALVRGQALSSCGQRARRMRSGGGDCQSACQAPCPVAAERPVQACPWAHSYPLRASVGKVCPYNMQTSTVRAERPYRSALRAQLRKNAAGAQNRNLRSPHDKSGSLRGAPRGHIMEAQVHTLEVFACRIIWRRRTL